MLKYKITNTFNKDFLNTQSVDRGGLPSVNVVAKTIAIPFSEETKNNGYSDLITELFLEEKSKNTNIRIDNEKLKFNAESFLGVPSVVPEIKFFFFNTDNNTFGNNYISAGFTADEVSEQRNNLKNSFYRIDFYDSNNQREQNFLFSEFLNVGTNSTPTFPFQRIFYKKEDPKFTEENTFVDLYFEVLFFDAKSGVVKNLINSPSSLPMTLDTYNANPSWRFAKLKVLNPYFNQPGVGSLNKVFIIESINGNSSTEIKFNELIII